MVMVDYNDSEYVYNHDITFHFHVLRWDEACALYVHINRLGLIISSLSFFNRCTYVSFL